MLAPTAFSIVPFTSKSVSYDASNDFKPITLLGYTANIMVVSPTLPVNTVPEFIEWAKSGDKHVTYASPGLGTPTQLGAEVFAKRAGIDVTHIPYRGALPAVTGLMAGEVTMMFIDLAPAMPLIEAGKLKGARHAGRRRGIRACQTCRRWVRRCPTGSWSMAATT